MYEYESMSKFLALILRHHPEYLDLKMDEYGWVLVDELLSKINYERREEFTFEYLEELVDTNPKQRFIMEERRGKWYIRANQGHSLNLNLGYKPIEPPAILYHGTGEKYLRSIQNKGLLKKGRQYVHLSDSFDVAKDVGKRHGRPIVFQIDAARMYRDGAEFYCSPNGVWLTEFVNKKYFKIIDN